MIYKIDYNHDGEKATAYVGFPNEVNTERVKISFYNYLRSLNISFLINKIEPADPQIAFAIMKNEYGFCFIQKEEI